MIQSSPGGGSIYSKARQTRYDKKTGLDKTRQDKTSTDQ
jgi:hypothetical protein